MHTADEKCQRLRNLLCMMPGYNQPEGEICGAFILKFVFYVMKSKLTGVRCVHIPELQFTERELIRNKMSPSYATKGSQSRPNPPRCQFKSNSWKADKVFINCLVGS